MSSPTLHVAVIGAGRWGTLHARKLAEMPGVSVRQIIDQDRDRAELLARVLPGASVGLSVDELMESVDAVTVATPASTLASIAEAGLRRGHHVFCEKPVATSVTDALGLQALSRRVPGGLRAGMIERFNPKLSMRPSFHTELKLFRWGPGRSADCGLGLDWAIHDLDLARWLAHDELRLQEAVGDAHALRLDLQTEDGRHVTIDVRSGHDRHRREVQLDGACLNLWRPGGDALADELAAFVGSVRGTPSLRLASIDDAVCALELLEAARTRLVVAA